MARRQARPRPEQEGAIALPQHEFALDVIALVGALRHREHRSVPEIHRALRERGVVICERSVTNLLERYEELLAVSLSDDQRLRTVLAGQGRVLLALDGLQPDVGHEVLWVLRDGLSGEVLLARSLLSARAEDLALLLREVADKIGVPIEAVLSDGQRSIRQAVARALPSVPHQLCHFHYLREAALPIYEADRHAKKGIDTPAATLATLARARSRAHASSVAGNRAELWLGACACPGAGERRRADGRSGRAPLGRPHGGYDTSPRQSRRAQGRRGPFAEGDAPRLARSAALLSGPRPAADQQRSGASVRMPASSRASRHGTHGRLTKPGASWLGSAGCGHGYAAAACRALRSGAERPAELVSASRQP